MFPNRQNFSAAQSAPDRFSYNTPQPIEDKGFPDSPYDKYLKTKAAISKLEMEIRGLELKKTEILETVTLLIKQTESLPDGEHKAPMIKTISTLETQANKILWEEEIKKLKN